MHTFSGIMRAGTWFPRLAVGRSPTQRGQQVIGISASAAKQRKPKFINLDTHESKFAQAEAPKQRAEAWAETNSKRGGGLRLEKGVADAVKFQVMLVGASKADLARQTVAEGMSVAGQVRPQVVQPCEEEFKHAAACVEEGGGRILSCHNHFTRSKEVRLGDWDKLCAEIADELGLNAKEQADMARAPQDQNGIQVSIFRDSRHDQVLSTHLATYRVACNDNTKAISCVYASLNAELDLEAPDDEGPPCEHQVECNGHTFAVLPSKAPGDSKLSTEMVDQDDVWMDIPVGWRSVDSGASNFQAKVLPDVIAKNFWATDWLLARSEHDKQRWSAWNTRMCGKRKGKRAASHVDWFEVRSSERRCVFRAEISDKDCFEELPFVRYTWPARLLIERVPGSQLIQDWRAYLQMRASTALAAA
eukprot:gnl/MRDRNA2_/MRDRNA2_127499_c0_seq1.p1 gnl/MRDRNA2_/MRDRNA2_127499_c0~~gnl/MRDRNA2_/MRDRNA2_127499_c0_seq1.p1  ORF type:complete len:418 (+),score=81.60 gnl/MRDRNA2_/MRDRNA2_127499_c0_seq1:29-1282(+)